MTPPWIVDAFNAALRAISAGPPKNLIDRALPDAKDRGEMLTAGDLTALIEGAAPDDSFLAALGIEVARWDCASADAEWADSTEPSSDERRSLICARLGLDAVGATALRTRRPIFRDETIVISAPWTPWYTGTRVSDHAFYWPHYRDFLLGKGWSNDAVASLDIATTEVVERLAEPTRTEAYQSKGLVVGYVQSGKTANFTGVVAKAIDAGYRLVIVMTGTIEMLRAQTQRRMDMELIGRQNIVGDLQPAQALEAKVDYQTDPDWLEGKFLDLGEEELTTEILRLTSHGRDYQKQFKTLKIDRYEMGKPLYDAANLFRTSARVAIVKKNSSVLKKLVSDLRANRAAFAEIPVLVIDDESDQASVNTVDPAKVRSAKAAGKEIKERRAINGHIAEMLHLMPRAQYVGYTATPFANVFADPGDEQGIFPKDFVIGLRRPDGYMGVEDFHDPETLENPTLATSNRLAFVRDLHASDDDSDIDARQSELAKAIDSFVLSGAVKLWRESEGCQPFLHHTMLVHEDVHNDSQRVTAELIRSKIWPSAGWMTPAGKQRLRELYEDDILPVSSARAESGFPAAPAFEVLVPFIPKAIARITEFAQDPVLIVNSDKDVQAQQQALSFDQNSTWRILVGGAKLSRGFTVEGLTTTYFRRATNMSDSLTQMGRWFGFRRGYRDLVRLYIARQVRFGKKTVDLYEAFESIGIDEGAFRSELQRYAEWDGGQPAIRPIHIPPLVTQHLPWLLPTAENKMFNAVLERQSEQPFRPYGYPNRVDHLHHNLECWRRILAAADQPVHLLTSNGELNAMVGIASATDIVTAIKNMKFLAREYEASITPRLLFYEDLLAGGEINDFLLFAPQVGSDLSAMITGVGERAVVRRKRRAGRNGLFGEISDWKHRPPMEDFVGGKPAKELSSWSSPKRGAVLFYLAREEEPDFDKSAVNVPDGPEHGLVVAFNAYVPTQLLPATGVRKFRVRDPRSPDQATVPVG